MIICLCEGTSDRQVERAAKEGATTVKEISRACGAGAGCGMCHRSIREIIQRHKVLAQCDSRVIEQAQFMSVKAST